MAPLAWVEVLDRRGHVRHRQRVDALPAVIGRAYSADVVLDDPWVSPAHLGLERDDQGVLVVRDLASENGTWDAARTARLAHAPLGDGLTLRLGGTQLRIIPAAARVAATLVGGPVVETDGWAERPWVPALLALAAGALWGINDLLGDPERHTASATAGSALTMVAVLLLWAGLWALVTRVVTHRARFGAHLVVASVVAALSLLLAPMSELILFLAPAAPALDALTGLLGAALAVGLLYRHLRLATTAARPRLLAISAGVILGLALIGVLAENDGHHGDGGSPDFNAQLKPLRATLVPSQDTTAFWDGIPTLQGSVDSLATADQDE